MKTYLEILSSRSDAEAFEPGEPIFREHEPGSVLFLLLDGEVRLEKNGKPVAEVQTGDLFGEEALLGERIRSCTALARTASRVVPIGPALYEQVSRIDPVLSWRVRATHNRRRKALVSALLVLFALLATSAHAVGRRAFVTSVTGTGDLHSWTDAGGLYGVAAGDHICQARAAANGLPNASAYRAWLSTSTTDAYCHVRGLTGVKGSCSAGPPLAAGPWYLYNGITKATGTLDELTGNGFVIFRPIEFDEYGHDLSGEAARGVWTGTTRLGTASANSCSNWGSSSYNDFARGGDAAASSVGWTSTADDHCNHPKRLLCLESGTSDPPLYWSWTPGSLAFVSSAKGSGDLSSWPQAIGTSIWAGDAICRKLATDAHLPAPTSFAVWLSDELIDAKERFSWNGPWRLPNGLTIANSKADLTDGTTQVGINMDETGSYLGDLGETWTGTAGDGMLATSACAEWTSADTGPGGGTFGEGSFARTSEWTDFGAGPCSVARRLYCLSVVTTIFWDGFEYTGDTSRWSSTVN